MKKFIYILARAGQKKLDFSINRFFLWRQFDIDSQKPRIDLFRYLFQHAFKTRYD